MPDRNLSGDMRQPRRQSLRRCEGMLAGRTSGRWREPRDANRDAAANAVAGNVSGKVSGPEASAPSVTLAGWSGRVCPSSRNWAAWIGSWFEIGLGDAQVIGGVPLGFAERPRRHPRRREVAPVAVRRVGVGVQRRRERKFHASFLLRGAWLGGIDGGTIIPLISLRPDAICRFTNRLSPSVRGRNGYGPAKCGVCHEVPSACR